MSVCGLETRCVCVCVCEEGEAGIESARAEERERETDRQRERDLGSATHRQRHSATVKRKRQFAEECPGIHIPHTRRMRMESDEEGVRGRLFCVCGVRLVSTLHASPLQCCAALKAYCQSRSLGAFERGDELA